MTLRRLAAALLALAISGGILGLAEADQKRRVERLSAAETKYGASYQGQARDGEGGGIWRLTDGTTVACRISGERTDPRLECGADDTEPPRAG